MKVEMTGDVTFTFKSARGTRMSRRKNMVLLAGKTWLAARAVGQGSPMTHIAVGSGSEPSNQDMATLACEEARFKIDQQHCLANTFSYVANIPETKDRLEFTEAGALDQEKGGLMLCRTTFPVEVKEPDEEVEIFWTITVK